MLLGQLFDLLIVHLTGLGIQAVLHGMEDLTGEIHLGTVGQMAPVCQAHAQNGVTRCTQGQIDGRIGL